jgi:hypothetical protein
MRLQLRFRASQESLLRCKFRASSAKYLALHKAPTSLGTDTQVHWAATIAFLSDATGPWRNTQNFKIMDGFLVISCARLTNAKIFYRTEAGESVPVARQDHFLTLNFSCWIVAETIGLLRVSIFQKALRNTQFLQSTPALKDNQNVTLKSLQLLCFWTLFIVLFFI